ncbi:MAG: VWA domain-containing protein [Planctomycetes bacterium]|nr:VWA domain-containing protein [Planctomycetota bacterium]
MNFVAPFAFALSGLAAAVIVLYILKVRRRAVVVPYLHLWQTLAAETRSVTLFKKLKRLLSLLLQLAILASLIFAVARPSLGGDAALRKHFVMVLDASASMGAKESGGRTRFQLLMNEARRLVESRNPDDDWMVVSASDRIDVLSSFTKSTIRLRGALDAAKPSIHELNVGQTVAFAREATRDKKAPVLLFLSDGNAGQLRAAIDKDPNARLIPIGEARENVGIVRFSARKNSSLGTDYIIATVRNYGDKERAFQMEIALNNVTQKVIPKKLAPGAEETEKLQLSLPQGGTLRLVLKFDTNAEPADALEIDNVAYAIAYPERLRRVVLVTEQQGMETPFRIAFESMAEVVDETSIAVTAEEYAALKPEEKQADITICHNVLPADLPPRGNIILIHTPMPSFLPAKITGEEAAPTVLDWDREHVLNRYLNYREMKLPRANLLQLSGSAGANIVDGGDSPLVAAFDLPDRRAVYIAFDMMSEMFPFRLAFPMVLRNSIAWFETEEDVMFEDTYKPGSLIRPLRKLSVGSVTARYIKGVKENNLTIPVAQGQFQFEDTEETGPVYFRIGDREYATAINLFEPAESSIAPQTADINDPPATGGAFRLGSGELWTYFAMAALILWAAEWALYHRRVTE